VVDEKFSKFIGLTDKEILTKLGVKISNNAKGYKRAIANKILGVESNHIVELEKANITLKAVTLEANGRLKESVSFPAFKHRDLVNEVWYDEKDEVMADLHIQLETRKFLFVVFQKQDNSKEIILKKTMFWNFPMQDIDKARDVWEKTIGLINEGKIVKEVIIDAKGKERRKTYFPGISYNGVVHVRPHGQNRDDMADLPVPDQLTGMKKYTKQCFWLNAGYIEHAIKKDQA
jgi:hypothetical protein